MKEKCIILKVNGQGKGVLVEKSADLRWGA
jgi:hypothetical protein